MADTPRKDRGGEAPRRRGLLGLGLALLALGAGLSQLHPLYGDDFWWSMVGAELHHGPVGGVFTDTLTVSHAGLRWLDSAWAAHESMVIAEGLGGWVGLQALLALAAAGTAGLLGWWVVRLAPRRPWPGLLGLALVTGVALPASQAPATLLSLPLLAAALLLLERPLHRPVLFGLFALQLGWIHTGGVPLLLPALMGLLALVRAHRSDAQAKPSGLAAAGLAVVGLLLGPGGPAALLDLFGPATLLNWSDLLPRAAGPAVWLWLAVLLATHRTLRRGGRPFDLALAGLALVVVPVRDVPWAVSAMLLLPLLSRPHGLPRPLWRRAEAVLVVGLMAGLPPFAWRAQMQDSAWLRPGLGLWQRGLPAELAQLLNEHGDNGVLHSLQQDAAFLALQRPEGMRLAVTLPRPPFVARDGGTGDVVEPTHALVERDEFRCTSMVSSPAWRLISADPHRALFTRSDSALLPGLALQAQPVCGDPAQLRCPASTESLALAWAELDTLLTQQADATWPRAQRLRLLRCGVQLPPEVRGKVIDAALARELGPEDLVHAAALLTDDGEPERALEVLGRAKALGGDAGVDLARARILLDQGRAAEAALLLGAAAVAQDDAMLVADRLLLAQALVAAERPEDAVAPALRCAWAGDPGALALLEALLPGMGASDAAEARAWIAAWSPGEQP
jgi:hypothetical protein